MASPVDSRRKPRAASSSVYSGDSASWEEKKEAMEDNNVPSPRCTPSPPSSLVNFGKRGARIARLASVFGQRKDNSLSEKSYKHSPSTVVVSPPSPLNSSSSGGYVGWPGTQDSQGNIVNLHSSYEESSVGEPSLKQEKDYGVQQVGRAATDTWGGNLRATEPAVYRDNDFKNTTSRYVTPKRSQQQLTVKRDQDHFHLADMITGPGRSRGSPAYIRSRDSHEGHELAKHSSPDAGGAGSYTQRNNVRSLVNSKPNSGFYPDAAAEIESFTAFDDSLMVHSNTQWSYDDDDDDSLANDAAVNNIARDGSMNASQSYDPYGSRIHQPVLSAQSRHLTMTQDVLERNDRMVPPFRTFSSSLGYHGMLDKTMDVPCLMDDADSESMASSRATSTFSSFIQSNLDPPARTATTFSSPIRRFSPFASDELNSFRSPGEDSDVFDGVSTRESDIFDGLSNSDIKSKSSPSPKRSRGSYPVSIAEEEEEEEEVQIVLLGGGLSAIQTNRKGFVGRRTASDYDENLTNSDVDQFGFSATPGFNEMLSAGWWQDNSLLGIKSNFGTSKIQRNPVEEVTASESGSSLFTDPYQREECSNIEGDLSEYAISPSQMKLLVRKYRKLSEKVNMDMSLEEFEQEEDEHKAFALFEMRSRIMEKDIERGLERCGGTVVVDDIVLTSYNRTAHRIRDALIVSKAWRDGARPEDVANAAVLTRRHDLTFFIRRPVAANTAVDILAGRNPWMQQCWWEPVKWMDDTAFGQFRCASLGPRHMRGVEMFTIGDCQSMLLKLTNERCIELRNELNEATKHQLEIEELLSQEADMGDGMMSETEEEYVSSMEEVKNISKDLVQAEHSFALVKDRIEQLVTKYHHLLNKIETESFAGASSVMTYESSYVSEHDSAYWNALEEEERAVWARRAQRAEVKAQIAAREALMLKQEARAYKEQKQRELDALQRKLLELQSEASYTPMENVQHVKLAQSFAMYRHDDPKQPKTTLHATNAIGVDRGGLDEVKRRFRDRMKDRIQEHSYLKPTETGRGSYSRELPRIEKRAVDPAIRDLFRSAGEEMCQQLDFYERSLRAVAMNKD